MLHTKGYLPNMLMYKVTQTKQVKHLRGTTEPT